MNINVTAFATFSCSFRLLAAWRHVEVTQQRTHLEWAACMKALVDVHFPEATCIRVIQDNLNTHPVTNALGHDNPAFLYPVITTQCIRDWVNVLGHDEVFAPAEAKRILDKLEFHFTPKHTCRARQRRDGSWLNMAEIEFSVLVRQCLDRRIATEETLVQETAAWEENRNMVEATVNWQFTSEDARIKLKKLYPSIEG